MAAAAAGSPAATAPMGASAGVAGSASLSRTGGSFAGIAGSQSTGALARPAPPRPQVCKNFLSRSKSVGQVIGKNTSQASALMGNLHISLKQLEDTIASDERSLLEMDKNLSKMQQEADRLGRQIANEEAVLEAMSPEKGLGSAMRSFDNFMGDVKNTYSNCRVKHQESMGILKQEFGYNPAYKRGSASKEFSAAYLTLAKDPSKLRS